MDIHIFDAQAGLIIESTDTVAGNTYVGLVNNRAGRGQNALRMHHDDETYSFFDSRHQLGIRPGVRIGTTQPSSIKFDIGCQDCTKMTVNYDGFVGIGTESPGEKLTLKDGDLRIWRSGSNPSQPYGTIKIGSDNAGYQDYWAGIAGLQGGGVDRATLAFYTADNAGVTERMRISSGGLVGIGTNLSLIHI